MDVCRCGWSCGLLWLSFGCLLQSGAMTGLFQAAVPRLGISCIPLAWDTIGDLPWCHLACFADADADLLGHV